MGDEPEPRRSGRATKGQHTKNTDAPEPAEAKKPKQLKKTKSKRTAREADGSEEDDEEEDALIRCVCGYQKDDQGRMMICCDKCGAWQHNDCMGLPEEEDKMPETYFCEQCKPEDHKELLAAMKRGERVWEQRAKDAAELKSRKKKPGPKGRGGRQSQGPEVRPEVEVKIEIPQRPESGRRKSEHQTGTNGSTETASSVPSTATEPGEEANSSRKRKASVVAESSRKSSRPNIDEAAVVASIADLTIDSRKRAAQSLQKTFGEQIKDMSKKGGYRIPDGHTADSLGEYYALRVEQAMFSAHCGNPPDFGGAYKEQLRMILFNIPKNQTLFRRLLDGSIIATDVATMDSTEMASEELQRKMASMKKETEKQSILVQDEGPRMRRTHKGDELIEDQQHHTSADTIMSAPPPRRRESEIEEGDKARSPTIGQDGGSPMSPRGGRPPSIDTSRTAHERRSSSNFDIHNVWSSVQSPDSDHPRGARVSSAAQPQQRQEHDADIDRLLNDDEPSPPYSPADYGLDAPIVWRGKVDMPSANVSIAKFRALSHHVAGSDLSSKVALANIFPQSLILTGRIDAVRADDYLTSLSAARSTDVTVTSLIPATSDDPAAQHEFDKLYTYLVDRKRYGVISEQSHREHVRDVYLVPLDAGMGPMPLFLQRLDHNTIEQPRPRRLLLAVFVTKWEPAHATPAAAGAATAAMSPVAGAPQRGTDRELARQILGPALFATPVAQRLMELPDVMPPESLQNLRRIFEDHPETRDDFETFTMHLSRGPGGG